jgi:hypothetical protein
VADRRPDHQQGEGRDDEQGHADGHHEGGELHLPPGPGLLDAVDLVQRRLQRHRPARGAVERDRAALTAANPPAAACSMRWSCSMSRVETGPGMAIVIISNASVSTSGGYETGASG